MNMWVKPHLQEETTSGQSMSAWTSTRSVAGSNEDWQQRLATSLQQHAWSAALTNIVGKLAAGEQLTLQDGLALYHHPNLNEVGLLANEVRTARFDNKAFFNSNVHVNQTNVCVLACKF